MKILLLLNGIEGCQTGIEDGFKYLESIRIIESLKWFYLDSYIKEFGTFAAEEKVLSISEVMQPSLIIVFHLGKVKITKSYLQKLKSINSRPHLIYDEGDMYGTWAKPITESMKVIIREADVVSIRGLGKFQQQLYKLNKNIIYTPHHADIARFDKEPYILRERKNKLVLIGNKVKPRFLSSIRRLPGAKEREKFIKYMGNQFANEFVLYGNGWAGLKGDQGPVDFYQQLNVYRDSWITVAYEHYPKIPYYFSNRLPIALLAGSLYVCHYHEGYEKIFKNCDFIFFFKSNSEAVDIVNYILSLGKKDLLARSKRARKFSLKHFHPNVCWSNFYYNIMECIKNDCK